MKEENKPIIKNLIYFLCGLIISIALCATFCIMANIIFFTKLFWLSVAAIVAIYFTGFRHGNIGKPVDITNYLYQQKPFECERVAHEAIGIAVIKRAKIKKEELALEKQITDRIASIKSKIEAGESQ